MDKKKKLLAALLAVMVTVAAAAGVRWNLTHYVLVDFRFYPRTDAVLDLRSEELPVSRYEKLEKKLPDCKVLWQVPLSSGGVSSDADSVTLTQLTAEDVALFAFLKDLKSLEAEGCRDYENLLALEQQYPDLEVSYDVELGTDGFDNHAQEIVVRGVTETQLPRLDNFRNLTSVVCTGGETAASALLREACNQRGIGFSVRIGEQTLGQEIREAVVADADREAVALLASLPDLTKLHLLNPLATGGELLTLAEENPQMDLTWEAEIGGARCTSEDRELDLSAGNVTELQTVRYAMELFPNAETVFLGQCAIDNETLSAFREEQRENIRVVWTVQLGEKLTARTDDTSFMPVREHVYYFNDEEAYNLRYCEDMVCIDIGHMSIHNIDFVEFMPDLEYLILAHTQLNYIEPISSCKKLKFLELDWSPIRDLSPLVGCTALEDLNLGNTFASFEPIKEMTWLKNLWVINCSSGTAYKMSQALPDTKVQGSGTATVDSGWRDLPNYYAMRDALGMYYMSW